ncbi:hypothetical protein PHYBOEH_000136 [Phytophthora boehmeriae]|uniref:Uncharacterized protein n=1 Tax=Phytophthora boehmeriae TaxID=109152 RepID=A0A8T1X8C6_9STRA|nr:hypothetical protein PHYBOEH_000136 [Phytophthora boehmeriae]
MIDDCFLSGSANVQMLIDKFELMAQANAAAKAPRLTRSAAAPEAHAAKRNALTIKTLESDDEDDTKTVNSYEDESDVESALCYTKYYSAVPRSPSSFSTASTTSLDSLLSSLDMFLPELLQASSNNTRRAKPLVAPKLLPPATYRRSSLSSSTTIKAVVPTTTNPRRSAQYPKTAAPALPAIRRCRRCSLSATSTPPVIKSARRLSDLTRGSPPMVAESPRTHRSESTPVPRYLAYDQSPRFADKKARNLERRRQLEERNRNLTAVHLSNMAARWSQSPQRQGCLDQVRSRLFDFQDDPKWSSAAKEKYLRATTSNPTAVRSRPNSTADHARG